jgi:GNAT superfamily N-acetyltransferase
MNLKNLLTLTIRVKDFNLVARQPELLKQLRKLTLGHGSGLNHELDRMLIDIEERSVDCQIILAYRFRKIVGWALLSKENSNFKFINTKLGFNKASGRMFQVFVDPQYRRQGIASEIYKTARKVAGTEALCVSPWDYGSYKFYNNRPDPNRKEL